MALENYMFPCLTKTLFGFECMGCGGQRALSFLVHGEFIAAFKMYPAIYTLIPLALLIGITIFYKFKNATKFISVLAIISILIIITSYTYKLIN
jgi:hypothetical protein